MGNKESRRLRTLSERLARIRAEDIMTKDVVTTGKNANLFDVAQIMTENRISGLPVVSGKGKLEGVVTKSDLFMVMDMIKSGDVSLWNGKGGITPTVKFAMSTEVATVDRKTTLDKIIPLMKYKNEPTIPVVEKGRIVGVIGKHDVCKNFYSIVSSMARKK